MRIFVDGGLVEVYSMDAVVLTAVAAPSAELGRPEQRTVEAFDDRVGALAGSCEIEGWKLSL